MPFDAKQSERLKIALSTLNSLSSETDRDGNEELLDSLLEIIEAILEKYPELEDDEED